MGAIQGINGNIADVDDRARLQTQAVSQSSVEDANLEGRVFTFSFLESTVSTPQTFLYFKNLGSKDIVLKTVQMTCSTADCEVSIKAATGIPVISLGVAVPATNMNLGSATLLDAQITRGRVTSGLTLSNSLRILSIADANEVDTVFIDEGLVVPQGKAFVLVRESGFGPTEVVLAVEVRG